MENIINDNNNLNIYISGSKLYGSDDALSDIDLIIIQKEYRPSNDINIHCFTLDGFIDGAKSGDIAILEVYFNRNADFILKKTIEIPDVEIDPISFRRKISMLTSNSWVKGKKKLIVVGDYDLRVGVKSIFHSLRILGYAISIGKNSNISDYSQDNYILEELYKLSDNYQRDALFEVIETRYKKIFNQRKSEFKKLYPIDKQKDIVNEISEVLREHGVFSKELLDDLRGII